MASVATGPHGPRPLLLANARVVDPDRRLDEPGAVAIAGGRILGAGRAASNQGAPDGAEVVDCAGAVVAPGLVDMRVFVGEPGMAHRETLASAAQAAARGGVTTIVTMPDTAPPIDDPALVDYLMRRARDVAGVAVRPMAALTKGLAGTELAEMGLLAAEGAVAVSNGRRAVRDARVLRRALAYAADYGLLVDHLPEDPDLAAGGVMNEGETATRLGLPGIPHEAEHVILERDVRLARLARARLHAAAVSSAGSLPILARAREAGADVTAAVPVTHVTLNELDVVGYRTFLKLKPPLREEENRLALVAGLADGTIDILVSGHDPMDVEVKRVPFAEAADGAVGLETLLPAALRLVHGGDLSLLRLFEAAALAPARRLGLPVGRLSPGAPADVIVLDPDAPFVVDRDALVSRSKNTPFEGALLSGVVRRTVVAGRTVLP